MRLIERKSLIPRGPFLIRYFPVFIGVIFSGIYSSAVVVVMVENYFLPSLSNAAAERVGVVLALFITLCNVMIAYGFPRGAWGMYGLFITCLLVAAPGFIFLPIPVFYVDCIFSSVLGLLLLSSKRHQEMRAKYVELRHMRRLIGVDIKKRRKHERAIIRIKKPR